MTPKHSHPRTLHSVTLPALPLECGHTLRDVRMAYHLDGELTPYGRQNVILVLHALTGSADAAGEWWRGLIGPNAPLDTNKYAVLSPNLLGSCYGSTGPTDATEGFPPLTTRDQARAVGVLLERLRIPRVQLVTGGSLGGMVALEFAATFPGRAIRAAVFAAPAVQGAAAIGWGHVQREAIRALGGADGLALARRIAMLTYRTQRGLDKRFGRSATEREFAVEEWLRAHGTRLTSRFSAASYLTLLGAMDAHDLGRGGFSALERLRASGTEITGVGIPGDLLYTDGEVRAWTSAIGAAYRTIDSEHGHDAFLLEKEQVARILGDALSGENRPGESNPADRFDDGRVVREPRVWSKLGEVA